MKLFDILLFVFAVCFFVIGLHQSYTVGVAESYWLFMVSLAALFMYGYRKNSNKQR